MSAPCRLSGQIGLDFLARFVLLPVTQHRSVRTIKPPREAYEAWGERESADRWSGLNPSYSSILIEQSQPFIVNELVKAVELRSQAITDKSKVGQVKQRICKLWAGPREAG